MSKINKYDKAKKDIPLVAEEEAVYLARVDGTLQGVKLRPKLIDLFAGAGGITLGFTKLTGHGFEPVWANDFNDHAARTYNANFGNHCIVGDIVSILENPRTKIPKADIVIGGPPCQGFSLLNKNRNDDPRKQLWRPYMDIVERSGASIFVMENVPQMLNSFEHGEIIGVAESLGFKLRWAKLCAADYGVSQTRWRAFIIGCKFADPDGVFPPKKTNYNINKGYRKALSEEFDSYIVNPSPWRTVHDAIADLPPPAGTEIRSAPPPLDLHFGRTPTPMSMRWH